MKSLKYAILIFLIWIISPLIISAFVLLYNNLLINPDFLIRLILPGIVFSIFSMGISSIKDNTLRVALFYSLIGILIRSSPAIYFLPSSTLYNSLSGVWRFAIIFVPTLFFSFTFFIIGKNKEDYKKDITDLYIKKNIYSK